MGAHCAGQTDSNAHQNAILRMGARIARIDCINGPTALCDHSKYSLNIQQVELQIQDS